MVTASAAKPAWTADKILDQVHVEHPPWFIEGPLSREIWIVE